jgi:hypothetical protein
MTTLFSVEKSFAGNLISINRKLSVDDVIITHYSSEQESVSSNAAYGVSITIKPEIITALQKAFGAKNQLEGIIIEGDTDSPYIHRATIFQDISFRGLRTPESYKNKYCSVLQELASQFKNNKDKLIAEKLEDIDKIIRTHASEQKRKVEDSIRSIVIDLNIKNINAFINDDTAKKLSELETTESELEAQIKALNAKRNAAKQEAYMLKRESVANKAASSLGEMGNAILSELKKEESDFSTDGVFDDFL